MIERKRRLLTSAGPSGPHIATVSSGNTTDSAIIAHFSTNYAQAPVGLTVTLPYKAAGYTSVKMTACGVNLLHCQSTSNGTFNGVQFTFTKNSASEVTSTKAKGTASSSNVFRNLNYAASNLRFPPTGRYATYAYSSDASVVPVGNSAYPYDTDGNGGSSFTEAKWRIFNLEHISGNTAEWFRYQMLTNGQTGIVFDTTLYPMCCLAGDSGCTFEPYTGSTITKTFSTIYGGTVDLLNGTATGIYASDGSTLATPNTYTFTPASLTLIVGVNNIWTTEGSVTVQYLTD